MSDNKFYSKYSIQETRILEQVFLWAIQNHPRELESIIAGKIIADMHEKRLQPGG